MEVKTLITMAALCVCVYTRTHTHKYKHKCILCMYISRVSLPLLCCWIVASAFSCDRCTSIMYTSCVQAVHWVFFSPQLKLCITSSPLRIPINLLWWWEDGDALKYWLWYGQLKSLAGDFSRKLLAACAGVCTRHYGLESDLVGRRDAGLQSQPHLTLFFYMLGCKHIVSH